MSTASGQVLRARRRLERGGNEKATGQKLYNSPAFGGTQTRGVMHRILFRGGTLVTATGELAADLLVEGETVAAIGPALPDDAEVIDVTGKLIFPGGVDPHTHFDLPMFDTVSSDDHYTGHKAAAFGGTTTVLDFVPTPPEGPLRAGLEAWHAKAEPKAAVDFSFHMNITRLDPAVLDEIPRLSQVGVTTLKVFTAYNGRLRLEDGEIFQVMRRGAEFGLLTMVHAENGDVIDVLVREALAAGRTSPEWHARTRPAWGAVEAALRAIALAAQADSPLYLVHMNTAGEVDQLRYARQRGLPVMGETCPPYLFFTQEHLRRQSDGSQRRFDGAPSRPREGVPFRSDVAGGEGLGDEDIDDIAVFGVDHGQQAMLRTSTHDLEDLTVLQAQAAVVGGEDLERRDPRSEERRVGKECRSRWSPYH